MPRRELERFVEEHEKWIDAKLETQRARAENTPELSSDDIAELKRRAGEYFPEKTAYFARIMGLTPASVKITSAKTRFGSCSGRNGICFSWRLMLYPEPAREYVVVHELSHIVHKNHGTAFYALIASVLPDYKERKKLLKTI